MIGIDARIDAKIYSYDNCQKVAEEIRLSGFKPVVCTWIKNNYDGFNMDLVDMMVCRDIDCFYGASNLRPIMSHLGVNKFMNMFDFIYEVCLETRNKEINERKSNRDFSDEDWNELFNI